MMINARRVVREQDKPALILLAIEDITEHYVVHQKLTESEAKYQKFVEEINSIIIGFDRACRITFFNHFSEKLFGYSRNEVIGKPIFGTIIPLKDSSGKDNAPLCEKIFADPAKYYVNESEGVNKDGRRLRISWSARAMCDTAGNITEILIDGNDITGLYRERREGDAALRESESSLKRAQEIAHLGSWELDVVANRLTWSDEIYRIFGLQPQEFGATYEAFLDYVRPDDREAVDVAYWGSVREGRDCYEIEHRVVRKATGEIRYVHEKCIHVRDSQGQIIRSLGMVHDITEYKQAEEQIRRKAELLENANRELEKFNRIAVGREMRMIGLKREINAMCVQLGEPPRYALEFADKERKNESE